jgi:hypothetical protein
MIVFALSQFGAIMHDLLARETRIGIVVAASIAGIIVDVRALLQHSFSLGLARQTPKALLQPGHESWVPPLVWGLDTGLIWTTYRVSFSSWALLLLAVLGMAPAWAGLVYGLAWAVPLVLVIRFVRATSNVPRLMSPRRAQWSGIASMAALGGIGLAGIVLHV